MSVINYTCIHSGTNILTDVGVRVCIYVKCMIQIRRTLI